MRRGVSLVEVVVVFAILGLMVGLLLPAVQHARAAANRTVCKSNLRQIGLGMHLYHEVHQRLPFARTCPAPWHGGSDFKCAAATPPTTYTGPGETWWAPYDNRPGATPTAPLAGFTPAGGLAPYLENSVRVFRCPDGFDRMPDSPTKGAHFQIAYAINPDVGGKRLSEVGGSLLVSEHDDLPSCRGAADHFTPWPATAPQRLERHEAKRHNGLANSVWYDGSGR